MGIMLNVGFDSRLHGNGDAGGAFDEPEEPVGIGLDDALLRFAAETLRTYGNLLDQDGEIRARDVAHYHAVADRLPLLADDLSAARAEVSWLRHMIQRAYTAVTYEQMSSLLERAMRGEHEPGRR